MASDDEAVLADSLGCHHRDIHVPVSWQVPARLRDGADRCFESSPCLCSIWQNGRLWYEACAEPKRNAMLRITVDKNGSRCRLKLAGRLGGPWVSETEKAWRSALCSATKQMEIDMKEVTAVDEDGRELLIAMHEAGACLVAQGVEMIALVEEITGNRPPAAQAF
jgi:hypothetical protein